jgi:hypothetical protein
MALGVHSSKARNGRQRRKEGGRKLNTLGEFDKMNAQTLDRQDFGTAIVQRSWSDEAFRKEFTANPESAFAKPANVDLELSDADLEKVAGGATPVVTFVSTVVVSVGASAAAGASVGLSAVASASVASAVVSGVSVSAVVGAIEGW